MGGTLLGRRHGRLDYGTPMGLSIIGGVFFVLIGGFVTAALHFTRDKTPPPRPPALTLVSGVIEPGLPVFNVLQRAGEPSCRAPVADGERWVYTRAPEAHPNCEPIRGDLVIFVQGDRIKSFMPEYEFYGEVSTPSDLEAFRRRYAPRR